MSTVGYGDLIPASDRERFYNIAAMVFGVAFYSYIIASISSLVQQKDAKRAKMLEKLEAVSTWVAHHALDPRLRRRIKQTLRQYYETRTAIDAKEILENLPPPLQDELCEALLAPEVVAHPLFEGFPQGALWKVLVLLQHDTVNAGAVLIAAGQQTSSLYILKDGYCDAECWDLRGDASAEKVVRTMGRGSSFGEYREPRAGIAAFEMVRSRRCRGAVASTPRGGRCQSFGGIRVERRSTAGTRSPAPVIPLTLSHP